MIDEQIAGENQVKKSEITAFSTVIITSINIECNVRVLNLHVTCPICNYKKIVKCEHDLVYLLTTKEN